MLIHHGKYALTIPHDVTLFFYDSQKANMLGFVVATTHRVREFPANP
jgi:hypothetical protein